MKMLCPQCGVKGSVADSYVGRKIRCPKCKQVFVADAELDITPVVADVSAEAVHDTVTGETQVEEYPAEQQLDEPIEQEGIEEIEPAADQPLETDDETVAPETDLDETDEQPDLTDSDIEEPGAEESEELTDDQEVAEESEDSPVEEELVDSDTEEVIAEEPEQDEMETPVAEPKGWMSGLFRSESSSDDEVEKESWKEETLTEEESEQTVADQEAEPEEVPEQVLDEILDEDVTEPEEELEEISAALSEEEELALSADDEITEIEDESLIEELDTDSDEQQEIEALVADALQESELESDQEIDQEETDRIDEELDADLEEVLSDDEEIEIEEEQLLATDEEDEHEEVTDLSSALALGSKEQEDDQEVEETESTGFTVFGVIKKAWQLTKGAKASFWAATIVMYLILIAMSVSIVPLYDSAMVQSDNIVGAWVTLLAQLVISAVSTILTAGLIYMGVRRASGRALFWKQVFSGFKMTGKLLVATILQFILIFIGMLLLVLPGIYLAVGYLMTIPLIMANKMSPWQAMETSRKAIHKVWWKMFGLAVVMSVIIVVSAIPLGLGLIWTLPMIFIVGGVVFTQLFGEKN